MKSKIALVQGGFRSRASRLALLAPAALVALGSQAKAAITVTEITDAITEGSTVIGTVAAAGLGVLGIFVGYKLVRRGVNKLI